MVVIKLDRLNPDKLYVEFRDDITKTQPIIGRRYTLTHSDITANLFLTIGLNYAYDKITEMRDEVLATWKINDNEYFLYTYCYVGRDFDYNESKIRYKIFNRELPLALEAIRYGDSTFFKANPKLDNSPVWVYFDSSYPEFSGYRYFGRMKNYK